MMCCRSSGLQSYGFVNQGFRSSYEFQVCWFTPYKPSESGADTHVFRFGLSG